MEKNESDRIAEFLIEKAKSNTNNLQKEREKLRDDIKKEKKELKKI